MQLLWTPKQEWNQRTVMRRGSTAQKVRGNRAVVQRTQAREKKKKKKGLKVTMMKMKERKVVRAMVMKKSRRLMKMMNGWMIPT